MTVQSKNNKDCAANMSLVQQQKRLSPKRHRFHTNTALIAMCVFSVTLFGASWIYSGQQRELDQLEWHTRRLDENNNDNNGDDASYGDYSSSSCNRIYSLTSDDDMDQRCAFAKTCNGGDGVFAPVVFCRTTTMTTAHWCWVLSPLMTIWLVLLFRMLGSTAEDFFSPSLEMFSVKLGLPPRFAGVSLLALGNGAADVSATVNAIVSDPNNGYHISLGALTGASMFVGGVVAGMVIVVAEGVRCRGALVRDVCALVITAIVVSSVLAHGTIGPTAISVFISMYLVFVLIVLIADVYHRAVVLPRMQRQLDHQERQRQLQEQVHATEQAGAALDDLAAATSNGSQNPVVNDESLAAAAEPLEVDGSNPVNRAITSVLEALSNYNDGSDATRPGVDPAAAADGWGVESDDIMHERPVILHGANGILNKHGHNSTPNRIIGNDQGGNGGLDPTSPYMAMMENGMDELCVAPDSREHSPYNWVGAFHDGKHELRIHFIEVWDDIVHNDDNNILDKFLLLCELPFTCMRKLTVPIPCEGYYCRALVALSVAVSPVWFGCYLWVEHEINLFWMHKLSYVAIMLIPSAIVGALILRHAPTGNGTMALVVSAPIAFYGFIIAATWIDTIADQLVNLLDFLGIIFRIPGSVMGMTLLAWGNSMGDLSANMTMARKGLANMAMTACFAGPVFNILIGLGLGFTALSAQTGEAEATVSMPTSVITGMVFILLNGIMILFTGVVLNKGTIPKGYGYAAVALYLAYLVSSLLLPSDESG